MPSNINIVVPTGPYTGETPFKGDLFERKQLADKLTNYLERINGSCVIAINAPWGDGKSWFGRNWEFALREQGFETAFIDAFASDYTADPFWLITSAITAKIKGKDKRDITKTAARVVQSALPFATKVLATAITNKLIGSANLDDILSDVGAGEEAEKFIENQLSKHEQSVNAIEKFKASIQSHTTKLAKRLVVFVDELDRCTPDFSVRLLERIKHFFEVDKTIFVLLINQKQLEQAILGIYGPNIDASEYLNKFINVTFNLPKRMASTQDNTDDNKRYCWEIANRYGLPNRGQDGVDAFIETISLLAPAFSLSYRDIEREHLHYLRLLTQ